MIYYGGLILIKKRYYVLAVLGTVSIFAIYFLFARFLPDYVNSATHISLYVYLVLSFIYLYRKSKKIWKSIFVTLAVPICVIGCLFMFSTIMSFINYSNKMTINKNQVHELETNKTAYTQVFNYENTKAFFDKKNMKLYISDITNDEYNFTAYDVTDELNTDTTLLGSAGQFYSIGKNINAAYIKNNTDNEILLQITQNNVRYIAKVDNKNFISILRQKDNYKKPVFKINDTLFYIDNKTKTIAYINEKENNMVVSDYNEIQKNDKNYIQRISEYTLKHYPSDYINNQNVSVELVGQKDVTGLGRINLYSYHCLSCENGTLAYSDIVEINKKDGVSIVAKANIKINDLTEAKSLWK